jgi:uncharacterized protein (DUF1015 family)
MAEILPFRALHYQTAVTGALSLVVTQPYDKITAEMQARYHRLSPYNLAHIIRGGEKTGDTPQSNVYTRAARSLHDWVESRALAADPAPGLYPYYQEYAAPGDSGPRKVRRGFIALCRLEDYSARVVHRHEETLSGPKADRLELLKHTRAHFGQIFILYSDSQGIVESALAAHTAARPWQQVDDEYSTRHSVWRVSDAGTIESVVEAMRNKKLVIADGHHRYETALAYRDLRRAQSAEDLRAEYVMMTFIRLETEGLTILPTHRVLHSLAGFDWEQLLRQARPYFDCEILPGGEDKNFLGLLAQSGRERPTLAAFVGGENRALLRLRPDVSLKTILPDLPESLARLDVVLLHRLLLERALGIDRQAVREQKNLRYAREAGEALEQVRSGAAQVCFLLNSTPVREVWENALAGNVLPQKSTDFFPKLLSGLAVYWLDNPAGI